jgi:hypothetical protein
VRRRSRHFIAPALGFASGFPQGLPAADTFTDGNVLAATPAIFKINSNNIQIL